MQIVGPVALGSNSCILGVHHVCFDCHLLAWFPVRVIFPSDAELKADSAWNPLPVLHLVPTPPSLPSTVTLQAWFLSLARLWFQIPTLCSGFLLSLTRGLSTKRRLLIICLKSPLRSAGRYDYPLVVNTAVCCHCGEYTLQACVWRESDWEWWGVWFVSNLLVKQPLLCQKSSDPVSFGNSLSRFYFENHLLSWWILAHQGNPDVSILASCPGKLHTQVSQGLGVLGEHILWIKHFACVYFWAKNYPEMKLSFLIMQISTKYSSF